MRVQRLLQKSLQQSLVDLVSHFSNQLLSGSGEVERLAQGDIQTSFEHQVIIKKNQILMEPHLDSSKMEMLVQFQVILYRFCQLR